MAFSSDPIMRWMWSEPHEYLRNFPALVRGLHGYSPVSVVRAARILSARCAGVAGSATGGRGAAGAPHAPQNCTLAASSASHWPQRRTRGVPHSWQNFVAAGFSCAQAGHAMLATVVTTAPSM